VENHVRIMTYPNTGMVVSSDLGGMTHPVNKSGYGSRAAALAQGMTYGKPIEYYGPIYQSHAVEGSKVRIRIHARRQKVSRPLRDKLQGFIIARRRQRSSIGPMR
jgi:sialate O-acetylesterase